MRPQGGAECVARGEAMVRRISCTTRTQPQRVPCWFLFSPRQVRPLVGAKRVA